MSLYDEHRRQNLAEQDQNYSRVMAERAEAEREMADAYAPMATMSDAHREWHLNSGVPMGQPGCPQDACHPIEDFEPEPEPTVKCGNKAAHGGEPGYHHTAAGVKECYASTGRFATGEQVARSSQVATESDRGLGVWHSTGPRADMGHYESQCPGPQYCVVMALPSVSAQQAAEQMRAAQAEQQRQARNARYAAWRTIPVYGAHQRGYYALWNEDHVDFYRVERPKEGKWAGRTYVKRQASDSFEKMGFEETGRVLDAIAADPQTAGKRYGQQIGRCYRCHRTLTDETSREKGIGPECAKKEGV